MSTFPQSMFEKEHTGFENTVNSLFRASLLAGVILPLSSVVSNGNSAFSYYRHFSNAEFSFSNPFLFWNNTLVVSNKDILSFSNEIEENFHSTTGFNQSVFLRNAISKNILHFRNSSIFESAVVVSTAIAQLRPFLNQDKFSGSNDFTFSNRFQDIDSTRSNQQRKNFQSLSTINLLNPLIWTSLYHIVFSYPFKGRYSQTTPYIRLTKTVTYLPYFDVFLAPYGPEVQMTNVFTNQNQLQTAISFRLSSTENENPFSVGLEVNDVKIREGLYSSGSIEVWNQPKTYTNSEGNLGGQVMMNVTYDVFSNNEKSIFGMSGGIGYKSYGFSSLPTLEESIFLQAGISVRNLP